MRLTRVIEYEGSEADVVRHITGALLSRQEFIQPGDYVPAVGPIFAGALAPKVTIRLVEQRVERDWRRDDDKG